MQNGGKVKHGTLCDTNLDSANIICENMGARLPTIKEFKRLIDKCGGDLERIHLQKKDVLYEACLVRNGFPIKQLYWTYSPHENVSQKGQLMHLTLGTFQTEKSYEEGVVYCVKDE